MTVQICVVRKGSGGFPSDVRRPVAVTIAKERGLAEISASANNRITGNDSSA